MLETRRYPTHEELEVIMARARRMRARFVAALIARGVSRVAQLFAGMAPRHGAQTRRLRMDAR